MQLEIVDVHNETLELGYAIARVVYAETVARSLCVVEALTSMIANATQNNHKKIRTFISDKNIFESLCTESEHHKYLSVPASQKDFQMCVRVATRMLHGFLPDSCNHATMFHRSELLPDWAIARGYVADIDGILFYM